MKRSRRVDTPTYPVFYSTPNSCRDIIETLVVFFSGKNTVRDTARNSSFKVMSPGVNKILKKKVLFFQWPKYILVSNFFAIQYFYSKVVAFERSRRVDAIFGTGFFLGPSELGDIII